MAYQRTTWVNSPTETTPINDTNLNNIESGIVTVDTATLSGWNVLPATLTYSSADAPTFVATSSVDYTGIINLGDRIKLTQTTVKYFIVTAIAAGTITLYGGTDYTLENSAITLPYYSHCKSPFGFPMNKNKWTVTITDLTQLEQTNPTQNTWYSIKNFPVPIGSWDINAKATLIYARGASAGYASCFMTISTANNTAGSSKMHVGNYSYISVTTGQSSGNSANIIDNILATSKTTYYVNIRTTDTGLANIRSGTNADGLVIQLVCAYL